MHTVILTKKKLKMRSKNKQSETSLVKTVNK